MNIFDELDAIILKAEEVVSHLRKLVSLASPTPVAHVSASANGANIILTYDAAQGAPNISYYNIYRGGVDIGDSSTTSYTDQNLLNGVYSYQVAAVDGRGVEGAKSPSVSITVSVFNPTPDNPVAFVASVISTSEIDLSWAAGSNGAAPTSYECDRSLTGTNAQDPVGAGWTNIHSGAGTSVNDTGRSTNTQYFYRVRALNGLYTSGYTTTNATTLNTGNVTLLFDHGFEQSSIDTTLFTLSSNGSGTTATDTAHSREGSRSLHTKITRSGTTNYRQEVRIKCPEITNLVMTGSEDMWMGFAIYIPTASNSVQERTVQQFNTTNFGSGYSPVVCIRTRNGNFEIAGKTHSTPLVLGAIVKNVWHDFVWRIRWRSQTATGQRDLYWNGSLVSSETGIVTGNPAEPGDLIHYAKCGSYHGTWDTAGGSDANGTIAEDYIDCLRFVMGNTDLYSAVAPQGNRLTAP